MLITNEDHRGQLRNWPVVREFVFAGRAVFTLRSVKTGMRFTYRVKVKKTDPEVFFVETLRGPDNTRDYRYAGLLRRPGTFFITTRSQVLRTAASVKALVWFLDAMVNDRAVLGPTLEVWHEGRCCCCGRTLTVPESVEDGIGPECRRRRAA
jgi:hypothetical protein